MRARHGRDEAAPVTERKTAQWPVVAHPCRDGVGMTRFRGPATSGRTTECPLCGSRFVYAKPPAGDHAAPQGGRTHF